VTAQAQNNQNHQAYRKQYEIPLVDDGSASHGKFGSCKQFLKAHIGLLGFLVHLRLRGIRLLLRLRLRLRLGLRLGLGSGLRLRSLGLGGFRNRG
jgi:hypothetical protein